MPTPVKVGTTIFGTYNDGPGFPQQSHLMFAVNSKRWWLFYLTSTADVASIPGTHTIKSFYSSSVDLTTASWTAGTDAPNLDAASGAVTAAFRNGRAMGCLYVNNATGTKKDLVYVSASLIPGPQPDAASGVNGFLRGWMNGTTITWDAWGYYITPSFNYVDTTLIQGNTLCMSDDGYISVAGCSQHQELDAAVWETADQMNQDSYTAGGAGTGNATAGSAVITNMSNQTGLKVGMGIGEVNGVAAPVSQVNSIDSSTQMTLSQNFTGNATADQLYWAQLSPGLVRTNIVIDASMTHECCCYGLASLNSTGTMLCVYDNGGAAPPNLTNLRYQKSSATHANGKWPNSTAGGANVFGSNVTQDSQDWCFVDVDNSNIFVARRTSTTAIEVNKYNVAGDSWAALPNQPPALPSGAIKAGGGLMGITNNYDMWLFIIDGTNNQIKYVRYANGAGTWGTWTVLCSVDATAKYLSGAPVLGPVSGVSSQAGLVYAVTNGGSFDAYVTSLVVGDPADWELINNRTIPGLRRHRAFFSR